MEQTCAACAPSLEEAIEQVEEVFPDSELLDEFARKHIDPESFVRMGDYYCPNCGEQCSFEHGSSVPVHLDIEGDAVERHNCLSCDIQLDVTLYDDEEMAPSLSVNSPQRP